MRVMAHNLIEVEKIESKSVFSGIDIKRAIQGAMGDSIALAKLLPKLFTTLNSSYRALIAYIENEDLVSAVKAARLIGTSSRDFGVIYLSKIATQMEQAIRSGTQSLIRECIITMGMALESFEREIDRLCPKT